MCIVFIKALVHFTMRVLPQKKDYKEYMEGECRDTQSEKILLGLQ